MAVLLGLIDAGSAGRLIATTIPEFLWESSFGVYLVVKGFKSSPITAGMVAPETPPAYRDVDA